MRTPPPIPSEQFVAGFSITEASIEMSLNYVIWCINVIFNSLKTFQTFCHHDIVSFYKIHLFHTLASIQGTYKNVQCANRMLFNGKTLMSIEFVHSMTQKCFIITSIVNTMQFRITH